MHDESHQVVGRIVQGEELLDVINELPLTIEDAPMATLMVNAVGVSDAAGNCEEGEGRGGVEETPEDAAARAVQAAEEARASVKYVFVCVSSGADGCWMMITSPNHTGMRWIAHWGKSEKQRRCQEQARWQSRG